MWEGNKLSDAEYKLHQSEQEQVALKKELTRVKLQLQEITEKLNDGRCVCGGGVYVCVGVCGCMCGCVYECTCTCMWV